jgi:hypothetical protein
MIPIDGLERITFKADETAEKKYLVEANDTTFTHS